MRRITTLMMLFLMFLGTESMWAVTSFENVMASDLSSGDRVRLMVLPVEGPDRGARYICYNDKGLFTDKNAGAANVIWTLKATAKEGQFLLFNESAKRFAGAITGNTQVGLTDEASAGVYLFEAAAQPQKMLVKCCNAKGLPEADQGKIYLNFQSYSNIVVNWNAKSSHSLWTVERLVDGNETPDVTPEGDYPAVADANTDYTHASRRLNGVALNGVSGQQQVNFGMPLKVYTPCLDQMFMAKAGETVTPVFNYSGTWMNGFVYIDRNQDGQFNATLNDELMSYSYSSKDNKDSQGNKADGSKVNPPSFTIPADMAPGIYRMRYKVDWDWQDPAGKKDKPNSTMDNGGAFCDILLNVTNGICYVSSPFEENGELRDLIGNPLENLRRPFNKPFEVLVNVAQGYTCQKVVVRHGYNLDGEQYVHGNRQYVEEVLPGYLVRNGKLTIPATMMDGNVMLKPYFVAAGAPDETFYNLDFEKTLQHVHGDRVLNSLSFEALQGGKTVVTVPVENNLVYQQLTDQSVSVVAGDRVNMMADFKGSGLHYYLYLDLNEDGQFVPDFMPNGTPSVGSELVAFTYFRGHNSKGDIVEDKDQVSMAKLPSFEISDQLANGNYRARLVVSYDDLAAAGSPVLAELGGYVVDFLLNVHNVSHPLLVKTVNGNVFGPDHTGLPVNITPFARDLSFVPQPVVPVGFKAENMTIKVGHRLDGPQVNALGNQQWKEIVVPAEAYTLEKSQVGGDVEVAVNYVAGADAKYQLIFSDEFDGENMSRPDPKKWTCSPRYGATWNRWISNAEDVAYQKDGHLVTRAVPNPHPTEADPFEMRTGAIQSSDKFDFRYGKVECRAKANLWDGTFPAIWMMPANPTGGWPSCGEIDIFEAVNTQSAAHHTIHSHWTYDLKKGGNTHNENVNYDDYHVYGLEWDDTSLSFFLDGKKVWTYNKSTNVNDLKQNQWPYDRNFYLILNQSVGNWGQWAHYPDLNHTYEFLIDWVRVYQDPHHAKECELRALVNKVQEYDVKPGVNNYSIDEKAWKGAKDVLRYADTMPLKELSAVVKSLENYITINQPEENHFYRVRCAGDGMKYLQSTQTGDGKQQLISGAQGKGKEATFLYTADGLISYTQGLYCGNSSLKSAGQKAVATFGYQHNDRVGQYSIKIDGQYLIGNGDGLNHGGLTTNYNDCNGGWWLEPVEALQVDFKGDAASGYYATLYSPIDLALPKDVKAYYAKQQDGVLVLTEVAGVPAHQGVLLVAQTAGSKNFKQAEQPIVVNAENEFVGHVATVEQNAGEEFYGLGYETAAANDDKPGFYLMDQHELLQGFRAHIKKSGEVADEELKLSFGEPTGIETLEDLISGKAEIYDLSGRRVVAPRKGIYMINGQKVYVK